MKLKEVAFMVSLINSNYQRRMLYLWGNIMVIVFALVVIYYNSAIDHCDHSSAYSAMLNIFFGSSCIVVALLRALVVYALKPGKFDDDSNLPWVIKNEQMKALKEKFDAGADFEELRDCVPLHEYFKMY